ncbi:hypothetical protein [Bacteroides sp.]|uniref:hypothetical protein n=1 Tax=Bacteroides sp. TaxID=29523 RepID=UPI0026395837|nr:hypothetical protein [Bacteroides sp.]MDD3037677.1 hypothetical protein [Bacteroides sp.]
MKRKIATLLLLMFMCISSIFSQNMEKEKKVDAKTESVGHINEQLLLNIPEKEMDIQYEISKLSIHKVSALTDFSRFQQKAISRKLIFIGNGQNVTYLGMGKYISVNGSIHWLASERLSLDVGGLFSRQFYFSAPISRQDMMGMNIKGQYALTNNIRLEVWGQDIFSDQSFSYPAYQSLFPHTGIGGSLSFDLKENAAIKVEAEYQYDKKTQKWGLESSGKVTVGF